MLDLLAAIPLIVLVLLAISGHEFGHAWVAYRLGDLTAKERGRLTLNPLKHLSLKYSLLMPLALLAVTWGRVVFALAKPVPINPLMLRNPQRDLVWVGLAGPFVNLFVAYILSRVYMLDLFARNATGVFFSNLLAFAVLANMVLATFNLLPIPPLDGSRVLVGLLPRRYAAMMLRYEMYCLVGMVVLVMTTALAAGGLERVFLPILNAEWRLLGLDPTDLQMMLAETAA